MDRFNRRLAAALTAGIIVAGSAAMAAGDDYRLSGPYTHNGLAIYLIHGDNRDDGPVPLTLGEAMDQNLVEVIETGTVQQLVVRNPGDRQVFIQSGDIVKGGKQDRVLTASMILQPHSGDIPVDAFCVEQGRWSGGSSLFAMSTTRLPSKAGRIAMAERASGNAPPASNLSAFGWNMTLGNGSQQQRMWDSVRETQAGLVRATGGLSIVSARSPTSLQLSLENKSVTAALKPYQTALGRLAEEHPDAVGYVFAIGGKINSGDEFNSAGLFRKLWQRQLDAAATEAIAEAGGEANAPPLAEVAAFIDTARNGEAGSRDMPGQMKLVSRATDETLFAQMGHSDDVWVHRSYVAR